MQTTTTDLIIEMDNVRDGHKYFIAVTGATTTVHLEFQHTKGGAWLPYPGFNATPVAGVILNEIVCFVSRMRLRVDAGQVTPWTASCVKQVIDTF